MLFGHWFIAYPCTYRICNINKKNPHKLHSPDFWLIIPIKCLKHVISEKKLYTAFDICARAFWLFGASILPRGCSWLGNGDYVERRDERTSSLHEVQQTHSLRMLLSMQTHTGNGKILYIIKYRGTSSTKRILIIVESNINLSVKYCGDFFFYLLG